MSNGLPFWRHPSEGWSERTRGLSEAQLDQWEGTIGFALPVRFRQLMAEQNGGSLRRPALNADKNLSWTIFLDPAPIGESAVRTVRDLASFLFNEKELSCLCSDNSPCYPERAVLISGLEGHECLVLDYGWRQTQPRESPRVAILIEDCGAFPYREAWSVENFEGFLGVLSTPVEFCSSWPE